MRPKKTKVKICGITSAQDAADCAAAGCHGLGFVFFRKSPRYLRPQQAATICRSIPARIEKIGVFVNAPARRVQKIARLCGLTMLQFHGDESPAYCRCFRGYKVVKALPLRGAQDMRRAQRYLSSPVYGLLFDSYDAVLRGGSGKSWDWGILESAFSCLGNHRKKFFVAGGLTAANVGDAVRRLEPDWVDVSSGVENAPGKKDRARVSMFIRRALGRRSLRRKR